MSIQSPHPPSPTARSPHHFQSHNHIRSFRVRDPRSDPGRIGRRDRLSRQTSAVVDRSQPGVRRARRCYAVSSSSVMMSFSTSLSSMAPAFESPSEYNQLRPNLPFRPSIPDGSGWSASQVRISAASLSVMSPVSHRRIDKRVDLGVARFLVSLGQGVLQV